MAPLDNQKIDRVQLEDVRSIACCACTCHDDDARSSIAVSDSTASNRAGLGNSLDRITGHLGHQLTAFIGRISERYLRRGPNVHVGEMLKSIDWGVAACDFGICPNYPSPTEGTPGHCNLPRVPSLEDIMRLLYASFCPQCRSLYATRLAQSTEFKDGCKKLIRSLGNQHTSARLLTAYYVSALASFHPTLRQIFIESGMVHALASVLSARKASSHTCITVPTRRALVILAGDACLPIMKEFGLFEVKLSGYYRGCLPESDIKGLSVHSIQITAGLVDCLMQPYSQVAVASLLSCTAIDNWASLLSIYPGLKLAVDPETVVKLWLLLAQSGDPIVMATIERFMRSLYDFMMWGWYHEADMKAGVDDSSDQPSLLSLSPWHRLWMPLFRLRIELPHVLRCIRPGLLEEVCNTFFNWRYASSRFSWEHEEQIKHLRAGVVCHYRAIMQDNGGVVAADPVLLLMKQVTSPLYRITGVFYRERCISRYSSGHEFQRAISPLILEGICIRTINAIAGTHEQLETQHIVPILRGITPWWDFRCRQVLEEQLGRSQYNTDNFGSHIADVILKNLTTSNSHYRLQCAGIVVSISHMSTGSDLQLRVLYTHRGPWLSHRIEEHYDNIDSRQLHLVTEYPYRDVWWVPASHAFNNRDGYQPIKVIESETEFCIGQKRDARIEPQGLLLPIELDTLHSSISPDEDTEQGLHILCSLQRSCCLRTTAFWMTRSSLIDAISGEQSANQLNIRKTFHRCLCSPAWSPAVSEVSEEGQGSAYRSIYELKPLRSYPRAYQ